MRTDATQPSRPTAPRAQPSAGPGCSGSTAPHAKATSLGALLLWAVGTLSGCGGDAEEPRTAAAPVEATAGAEAPAEPAVPTGPAMSYVADDHSVIVRLDMARVRESPLSQEIATRVRRYPTWAALLGGSGIDPVDDFDRVLVTAPSAVTGRSVLVIRHHLTPQQVREAVLNVAVEQGARPEWREEGGFDVVDWPAPTDPPRVLIVASEQEMIVVTPEDLERALAVARDHALRRSGDEVIEPALHLEDGVVTTVAADEVESFVRGRFEHVPDRLEVELREDAEEEGRLRLRAHGIFADDAAAEAAHRYLSQQRDRYAGHMLVRAVGLDRPLMEATIEVAGNRLDVQASFTEEEMQRVFGLMELAELGGS